MTTHVGGGMKVLVVEDDDSVRRFLDVALQRYGFEVVVAASGLEAVEFYRDHHATVSVILLDVRMAPLDGPGTLAALQAVNPEVRSVFMSGHTGGYTVADLLLVGASRVFDKPLDIPALAAVLRQVAGECV